MELSRAIDAGLLRSPQWRASRSAQPPATPRLTSAFDDAAYRAQVGRSNQDPIPRPLAIRLAVHPDVERLTREIEEVARHFDRDREVVSLRLDATAADTARLGAVTALTGSLRRHFHFAPAARHRFVAILDPRTLQPGELASLAALGVEAVEFVAGVEATQAAVHALAAARRENLRCGIEVTLGLDVPDEDTRAAVETLLAARPDRIALVLPDEHADTCALALHFTARLEAAGYAQVGLDPRPLSWVTAAGTQWIAGVLGEPWPLPPVGVDVLGLGIGALSRIGDCIAESHHDSDAWAADIDAGLLPVWRGCVLTAEEHLRVEVIEEWLRTGEVSIARIERRYGITFSGHFAAALQRLSAYAADGMASVDAQVVRATSQGRRLLRIMAECFDIHPPSR